MNTNFSHSILHIDADAFFVSCEEARRPDLKNKVVVTGLERGVISALNYRAKALGLKRAMSIREAKKICPDLIFLPADYRTYILYSKRMYKIVRRFSSSLEEYSIDECFVDLSEFKEPDKIMYIIKDSLEKELGISFSLGLAGNKVLAKVASNFNKPAGLTIINLNNLSYYLKNIKIAQVWGIGQKTSQYLNKLNIITAFDFIQVKDIWVKNNLNKNIYEIYLELKGNKVLNVNFSKTNNYQSISKTKTFNPSSNSSSYIFSQLSKNIEEVCFKLRQHNLVTKKICFFLKKSDLTIDDYKFNLDFYTNNPKEILRYVNKFFPLVFKSKFFYRATGIFCLSLIQNTYFQDDLFSLISKENKIVDLYKKIDKISQRYGQATIFLASSLKAKQDLEVEEKALNIPYLGDCK